MKYTKTRARKVAKNKRRTKRQKMKGGQDKLLYERLTECGMATTNRAYFNTLMQMVKNGKIKRNVINNLLAGSRYTLSSHYLHFMNGEKESDNINCQAIQQIARKWDELPSGEKKTYTKLPYGIFGRFGRESRSLDWLVKLSQLKQIPKKEEVEVFVPLVDTKSTDFRGPKTNFTRIESRSKAMNHGDNQLTSSLTNTRALLYTGEDPYTVLDEDTRGYPQNSRFVMMNLTVPHDVLEALSNSGYSIDFVNVKDNFFVLYDKKEPYVYVPIVMPFGCNMIYTVEPSENVPGNTQCYFIRNANIIELGTVNEFCNRMFDHGGDSLGKMKIITKDENNLGFLKNNYVFIKKRNRHN